MMTLKVPVAIDALWLITMDWISKLKWIWAKQLSSNLNIPTDLIKEILEKEWDFQKDKSNKLLSKTHIKWIPLIISAITKFKKADQIRAFFIEYMNFLKNKYWEKAQDTAIENFEKAGILLEFNVRQFWIRTIWWIIDDENFKKKYWLTLTPRNWK